MLQSFSYASSKQQLGIDTRLHDLVMKKFPSTLLVEKQRQLVKLLTTCDPNGLNAEGTTPLHLAVQVKSIASLMLKFKCANSYNQLCNNFFCMYLAIHIHKLSKHNLTMKVPL